MDDQVTDSFTRAERCVIRLNLELSTHVFICACEMTVVLVMYAAGPYSV